MCGGCHTRLGGTSSSARAAPRPLGTPTRSTSPARIRKPKGVLGARKASSGRLVPGSVPPVRPSVRGTGASGILVARNAPAAMRTPGLVGQTTPSRTKNGPTSAQGRGMAGPERRKRKLPSKETSRMAGPVPAVMRRTVDGQNPALPIIRNIP